MKFLGAVENFTILDLFWKENFASSVEKYSVVLEKNSVLSRVRNAVNLVPIENFLIPTWESLFYGRLLKTLSSSTLCLSIGD